MPQGRGGQTCAEAIGACFAPGESERDFRVRLAQAAREERDRAAEDPRRKCAPKITVLEDRIRRARQAAERDAQAARSQKLGVAVSIGATPLGAFPGRKTVSAATAGRGIGTLRRAGRDWPAVCASILSKKISFT
jgi:hypothetical protein